MPGSGAVKLLRSCNRPVASARCSGSESESCRCSDQLDHAAGCVASSWYSCSTFTFQIAALSRAGSTMHSTASLALTIECILVVVAVHAVAADRVQVLDAVEKF